MFNTFSDQFSYITLFHLSYHAKVINILGFVIKITKHVLFYVERAQKQFLKRGKDPGFI
jgi:hypothetical protein